MAAVAVETRPLRGSVATAAIRYVGLALFVVSVYLGIVVAGSALVGSGEQRTFLMLVATALVAVAMGPTTRWLAKLANRIVCAHRLSPWEAVSRLSTEMGAEQDPDEILARLAGVVRDGTGSARVVVWLRVQRALVPVAASPEGPLDAPVSMDDGELPDLGGAGSVVAIRQAGETLGAITVDGDRLLPLERKLVDDLAAAAAVVTRAVQLRESVRGRLDLTRRRHAALTAARASTARAQLEERRHLERNLHDTCQQRAVVLAGKLGLVRAAAAKDPARAAALLDDVRADVVRLRSTLADVVGGRSPSELVDGGIGSALEIQVADLAIRVDVQDELRRRHRLDLEEAVYACCMEAIQNAIKHSAAAMIDVTLREEAGTLRFRVRDDGTGFDTSEPMVGTGLVNMRQRLATLGGNVGVRSDGGGTEVSGEVPL